MRRFNQRQWEAIRLADRHVLVAAGAGTGKTSTVVGRILYLLGAEVNGERIGRPVRLREIGAITYTNAAAADLKRKLRGALREAGLRDAADEVDTARIGTIHAFCGDVLREFALRTGRDPFARVLEEGESAALADEATREAVLEALEGESVPHLRDLFATYSVAEVEGWVRALVGDSGRLRRILVSDSPHSELERGVLALAQRTLIRLEARLGEIGAFDFDRMIAWTRDLLADHPAVRRALQRRLHTLVVDEFQDVDPVQREIAYLLGEPDRDDPHTTRLMLVGDPKQSIYRFRRADVTVWTGVERDFREKGWGEVVALEENFRSVAPILALVDHAVGAVLDTPVDGRAFQDFEVRYAAVRPTRGPAGGDGTGAEPAVELLVVLPEDDGEKPKMEEVRAREAAAVARRAAELHDGGRGVRLGEMAVLLATWSDLEIYERALRRAGLRTYALRTEGFHERREVQDLVLALEAIRDPRDDRALFGFLRSPFVGVRDETLLALARAGSAPRWEHLERVECAERDLLRWAAAVLREQVALRDRVPTHELLERLLERTGYLAYLHLLGDAGLQAIANVRKLVRMARQLPEQGVGDFLRALKEARERKEKEGDARLHGERDDVLTITTIHSAKGLEWGVVFWCDLSRKPGGREGSILVGRDRIALRDPEAKTQSTQWIALSQAEEREGTAEQKRLWYVAATRAKDRLVLAGFCPGKMKSSSPGQALWERLGVGEVRDGSTVEYRGHDGRTWRALLRVAPPLADGEPAAVEPAEEAALAEPPAPVVAIAGRTRHSATELMLYARCPRRHWFRYVAGLREPEVPRTGDADGTGGPDGVVRGQIVHQVLEHLGERELDRLLEDAIGRWDPDAPTPEHAEGLAYREALRAEVERVADHPEYRALAERPGARRELEFVHLAGADGDGYLEGKIDLASRSADGVMLLDVKTYQGTDPAQLAAVAARYRLQRDAYVAAVEAIAGEPVARFAFHFSRAGRQVVSAITAGDRAAARERLAAMLREIGQGEPGLARDAGDCRWCGYRAVGWCEGAAGS